MKYSVVLETANLSFVERDSLWQCLDSIQAAIQKVSPPESVLLYAGGEICADTLAALRARYAWVTVIPVEAGTSYYGMKMEGARKSNTDVIVMADSDCTYNQDWLAGLLEPFENPDVQVVAGETTFGRPGPYSLALAISFAFDGYSDRQELYPVNYYYANNAAFRRRVLLDPPIPTQLPLYRSGCFRHCVELRKRGVTIWAQPRSRANHTVLEGFSLFFWRFLLFGRDRAVRRRLELRDDAPQVRQYDQGQSFLRRRLGRALKNQPEQRKWLPLALLIAVIARILVRIGDLAATRKPERFIGRFAKMESVNYPTVAEYLANRDDAIST